MDSPSKTLSSVVTKMVQREQKGKREYGQTLDRTDLNLLDFLTHAQEEAMDHALYLEKAIQIEKERLANI